MDKAYSESRFGPRALALAAIVACGGLSVFVSLDRSRQIFSFLAYVPGGDVTAHFLIMGGLSLLVNWGFSRAGGDDSAAATVRRTTVLLVVIGLEEASQLLLETRTFSWADLLAGWAGVVLAAWGALCLKGRIRPGRF